MATYNGHIEIVDYLCGECDVNIEKVGIYRFNQNEKQSSSTAVSQSSSTSIHYVTSFWCACVRNHLNIVKLLHKKYKANINSKSDSLSTALRSACYMSNYDVCEYLLENNADINESNFVGGTPLINSIQSLELMKLLIKYNVNVNYQDFTGSTALHYAIIEDKIDLNMDEIAINFGDNGILKYKKSYVTDMHDFMSFFQNLFNNERKFIFSSSKEFEIIKVLVNSNADLDIKNVYNENSCKLAASKGSKDVLAYLFQYKKKNFKNIKLLVECLRLLGSVYIDLNDNLYASHIMWTYAYNIEQFYLLHKYDEFDMDISSDMLFIDSLDEDDQEFFNDVLTFNLNNIFDGNHTNLNRYSCYLFKYSCLQRVLSFGKFHRETFFSLIKRGAYFADINDYKQCLHYWYYALNLTIKFKSSNINQYSHQSVHKNEYNYYFDESLFLINSILSLYYEIINDKMHLKLIHVLIDSNDLILKLFKSIVIQLNELINDFRSNFGPIYIKNIQCYNELIIYLLNYLCLIINLSILNNNFEHYISIKQFFKQNIDYLNINTYNSHNENDLLNIFSLCFTHRSSNSMCNLDKILESIDNIHLNTCYSLNEFYLKYQFPNLNCIKLLLSLNVGFNLNKKDYLTKETPLFLLLRSYVKIINNIQKGDYLALIRYSYTERTAIKAKLLSIEETRTLNMINYALLQGAHCDIYDFKGVYLADLIKFYGFNVNWHKHETLACLCAHVIKKYSIKYDKSDIPYALNQFIEMH